jgi:Putative stress-responsive transcriptional regulator
MENRKRLERDLRNKVIGGVCSGLGNYFGIDDAILRVLFVVAFLIGGSGLGLYLILWIVMPAKRYDALCSQDRQGQQTQSYHEGLQNQQEQKEQESETESVEVARRGRQAGLIAGLCFILIGIGFLVSNFIPSLTLERYWPVILIVIGLFLIIPTKKSNNEK